jgi:YidC/Oxa1 family membrane protein insertase
MENRRFILIALLGVVIFFRVQAWKRDFAPATPSPSPAAAVADEGEVAPPTTVPPPTAPSPTPATTPGTTPAATATPEAPAQRIRVETDLVVAQIASVGGELRRVELKGYPVSKDKPQANLALLDDHAGHMFVLQSGLASNVAALVTHKTPFTSESAAYHLADGAESLDVPLDYVDAGGFSVRKIYRFHRGSYAIELVQILKNTGAAELTASPYLRYLRDDFKPEGEPQFSKTFTGAGVYEQRSAGGSSYKFVKSTFKDLAKTPIEVAQTGGWISMLQHYFVCAILPPADQSDTLSAKPTGNGAYLAQYVGAGATLPAGTEHVFTTGLYVGPKLQKSIGAAAPGLELTVDYGILTPISEPLFWLLDQFHKLTHNWGFSIILLTLAVKGAMFKLSEAQYRSMAKMKKFSPKIQEIKERYGDDRERMQKAMMELYKKEGFNPLAGCWPLLVQFPVFIALYWVLLESVEMRQAPFVLWVQDLSAPDPFYVLPVLFGISMFVQQKLSGQQVADPMQQKIMNVMPIMLTAFFAFFQSGLVLYWFVSNLIGIAQQWVITRRLEKQGLREAPKR